MQLVVDTNILIAGFIRSATTRELLLDERLALWTPELSLSEAEKVLLKPRIYRKIKYARIEEVRTLLGKLTANLRVVPASTFKSRLVEAEKLAPHSADAPFLALALHLELPLWSNDQELKTHQQVVAVYSTFEILSHLQRYSS